MNLPEYFKIVTALAPISTSSARTGDYISLKNANKCWVVLHFTQAVGHATAITIEQATNVAAGSTTAITVTVPIWYNLDTDGDTLTRATDAVSYTLSTATKGMMVVFEIDPRTLADGFDCITVKTAASSQSTNFVSAIYYIDTKYKQATPPSAIID